MPRKEFSKATRRQALLRSGMKCEASGAMYGLEPGQRCNADLSYGVEYDHIVLAANGGEADLANCAAVCIKCHRFKTAKHDVPMAAKTVRMQDKARNIKRKTQPIKSPGFAKAERKHEGRPTLPPRPMFRNTGE